jgi:3-deoxy-D-manno-octulosonic-acid transferase
MYFLYSLVLSAAFVLMSPLFRLRRKKYAAGFSERLGNYPKFEHDGRPVIWLHCVSVGETNAARPLADSLPAKFPGHRLIVSTTTRTGQELAKGIFAGKADAVFYFPFDFKFSVRRAIAHFKPSIVFLMETEIWPRFIKEAKANDIKVAIVNGRLSERSYRRYAKLKWAFKRVLAGVDLALMQAGADANRLISLGIAAAKVHVTGNLKFDVVRDAGEDRGADQLDRRFRLAGRRPLIIAASTHEPEEHWIIDAYCSMVSEPSDLTPRLLIAPRHPERFDSVARTIEEFRSEPGCEWRDYRTTRRSARESAGDDDADVILLDSIGELRSIYRFAELVFVGGSLVRHGGQSILEPAAAGKAVITGPHTHNFAEVVGVFLANRALIQLEPVAREEAFADELFIAFTDLLEDEEKRSELGRNAAAVIAENRGATELSIKLLEERLRNQ